MVLVVDDEVAIVQLLAEILLDAGLEVITAHDGRGALKMLRGGLHPQVIVSDIMMPGVDGWELYSKLRGELGMRETGVILMSAGRIRPPELNDPRTRFVAKPFDIGDMLAAIEELG